MLEINKVYHSGGQVNLANPVYAGRIKTLHVIEFPNGRFGYVGKVPASIGYIDPTPEKLKALTFGARFGPKVRTFATRQDAINYAQAYGHKPA
jgi:hypothetical protein